MVSILDGSFGNARILLESTAREGSDLSRFLQNLVRVKGVPQTVANVVHRNDRKEDHDAGEDRQPGIANEVLLRIAKQIAPAGRRWLDAETQEAEAGLLDDGIAQL